VIDAHLHVVDFLQHPLTAAELGGLLRDGVSDRAVVFGLPVKKKWATSEPERPTYYLDDNAPCAGYSLTDELVAGLVAELDDDLRDRVAPLVCGLDPTDLLATDHLDLVTSRHDGFRGVGEVLLRHDDLTELTYGENARASHPALDGVLEYCRDRGWPFLFHQDASSAGRGTRHEYVGELDAMLRRHRGVAQVWAHAGVSRRIHPDDHHRMVGDLLDRHPHLHVDLSWALADLAVPDGRPHPDWLELVGRHPDRFVLGSDAFGDVGRQAPQLAPWTRFADALPRTASALVTDENARRLWFS
jgi:hypothetical protein